MRVAVAGATAVLAAGIALLPAACGGSGAPRPDLLLVSTRDGDYAIYAMNADGSRQMRLTESDADPSSAEGLFFQVEPAWSPDARSIAFASSRSGSSNLYAMTADGSGTHRLTVTKRNDTNPSWSPDGARIAFERDGKGIYVMQADGSRPRLLSPLGESETQPAWSPDGRWLAFVRLQPGSDVRELWLMRPDGSARRQLTSLRARSSDPAWSPDGRQIAFSSNAVGPFYDIFTLTVGRKGVRRLTERGEDAFEPAWSPDGATIAYSQGGSIIATDLEGHAEELTDPANNDSSPAWNPRPPPA